MLALLKAVLRTPFSLALVDLPTAIISHADMAQLKNKAGTLAGALRLFVFPFGQQPFAALANMLHGLARLIKSR